MPLPTIRLFILGAGFSDSAGLPLGADLFDQVRNRVRQSFQQGGEWDGPLEEEIQEWCALYPGKALDLESVLAFSNRKHYLRLNGSEEMYSHGSESIVATREAIQEILIASTPQESPPLYKDFAKRLAPGDVVLTFNYDTLLEQALDDIGKPYSLTPEWWLKEDAQDKGHDLTYVEIYKLHGSVDWYDRHWHDSSRPYLDRCGVTDTDPMFGPSASIPIESLARGEVEDGYGSEMLRRIFRVPNHKQHFPFRKVGGTVVPFILPPAHEKLLGHEPVRCLWENMHRTGDRYSVVTIIGYSMPSHDNHAYEALGHLLLDYQKREEKTTHWGQRRSPVQIVSRAPSAEEAMRIPFLRTDRTRVWHRGFNGEALEWIDWGD